MTQKEKIELLKDTIVILYEKEGRSKKYISRVLYVDRATLTRMIREWGLIKADQRHFTPSNEKFLNKNRQRIIDMLDSDVPKSDIARTLGISRSSLLHTFIENDKELAYHSKLATERMMANAEARRQSHMEKSSRQYDFDDLDGEEWKPILGYPGYEVSNMGRVKHYINTYKKYCLLTPMVNSLSGRYYVAIVDENGKSHNISLPRIVAHAFVSGYSDINCTVDHKDSDISNNKAENLEWVSQGENNSRIYRTGRPGHKAFSKNRKFQKIILDGKYEFKTFVALAKFMGVSETQLGRYIDGDTPTEHTFEFIR